ncbi:MAG TPA: hypothetical protein EYP54_07080 [Anaerolineales bacterium]|nr:hypothetical protein [Anaerolineales bacterium]
MSSGDRCGDWLCERQTEGVELALRVRRWLVRRRTPYQELALAETEELGRVLALDGKIMLSERDEPFYHEMLAHPALLDVPMPTGEMRRSTWCRTNCRGACLSSNNEDLSVPKKRIFSKSAERGMKRRSRRLMAHPGPIEKDPALWAAATRRGSLRARGTGSRAHAPPAFPRRPGP